MTSRSGGLEGVVAGTSAISSIDGLAGKLTYRGIDIFKLASDATFEEVAHLLWHDELPTQSQLDGLLNELSAAYTLPPPVIDALRLVPRSTPPMDALRSGVSMLGAFDPDLGDNSLEANARKSVRLLAQVSAVVATLPGSRPATSRSPRRKARSPTRSCRCTPGSAPTRPRPAPSTCSWSCRPTTSSMPAPSRAA